MVKDSSYPKKVYVSRRSVSDYLDKHNIKNHISRYNEDHVENALEDFFVQKGYEVINFSGMPIQQQIMYMYNATHVSGLMGANTWNSIFCDNGVKHYCLQTHMWFNHEYNKDMEKVIDFDYQLVKIHNVETYESVVKELSDQIVDA
jgi:capsular polysaccharide biosynthesis protein